MAPKALSQKLFPKPCLQQKQEYIQYKENREKENRKNKKYKINQSKYCSNGRKSKLDYW